MYKNINLQFVISYFGLTPYFIIIIDKFFLHQIDINIAKDFIFFYSIIIFVFIGSINWNLKKQISKWRALYGFSPSFLSVSIIIFYLYNFKVYSFLIFCFLVQLILDYLTIFTKEIDRRVFYKVRLPLTILIVLSLAIIL